MTDFAFILIGACIALFATGVFFTFFEIREG
jgi:hypothetical protein